MTNSSSIFFRLVLLIGAFAYSSSAFAVDKDADVVVTKKLAKRSVIRVNTTDCTNAPQNECTKHVVKIIKDGDNDSPEVDVHGNEDGEVRAYSFRIKSSNGTLGDKQTSKEIEMNVDNDVESASTDPSSSAKKTSKIAVIEMDDTAQPSGKTKKRFTIERRIENSPGKSVISINGSDENGSTCNVRMCSDSTKKGRCYSLHLEGLHQKLAQMSDLVKGFDPKQLEKVREVLKSLRINVSTPDSALNFSLNGEQTANSGTADIELFVSNDDNLSHDNKLDVEREVNIEMNMENDLEADIERMSNEIDVLDIEAELMMSDNDDHNVSCSVYVFTCRRGGIDEKSRVTTERTQSPNQLSLESFSLSPNPSQDGRFVLKFTLPTEGQTDISITNLSGVEVFNESLSNFSGSYEKPFDLTGFGKGVYMVRVVQKDKNATLKVVID